MRSWAALACALLAACAPHAAAQPASRSAPVDPSTVAYRRLHPSVAYLTMQIPSEHATSHDSWDDAFGSGIVVESGSWGSRILTDAHVVAGARNLRATIGDRGPSAPARVVALTPDDDDRDLALLETHIPNRPVAVLGTARGLEPGRPIGVLGYPIPDAFQDERLGVAVSLYTGRIASIRPGALELDLPIIPGESGGPVFDVASGAVVGIAESRFEEEKAIGFATPIDLGVAFLAAHVRSVQAARSPGTARPSRGAAPPSMSSSGRPPRGGPSGEPLTK